MKTYLAENSDKFYIHFAHNFSYKIIKIQGYCSHIPERVFQNFQVLYCKKCIQHHAVWVIAAIRIPLNMKKLKNFICKNCLSPGTSCDASGDVSSLNSAAQSNAINLVTLSTDLESEKTATAELERKLSKIFLPENLILADEITIKTHKSFPQ